MRRAMKPMSMSKMWLGVRRSAGGLLKDRSGIAAIESAVIVPIMLVMFFGTVEFSSAVAIDRKVTLMARTLANLTSQGQSVNDAAIANFRAASGAIGRRIKGLYIPRRIPRFQSCISTLRQASRASNGAWDPRLEQLVPQSPYRQV